MPIVLVSLGQAWSIYQDQTEAKLIASRDSGRLTLSAAIRQVAGIDGQPGQERSLNVRSAGKRGRSRAVPGSGASNRADAILTRIRHIRSGQSHPSCTDRRQPGQPTQVKAQ